MEIAKYNIGDSFFDIYMNVLNRRYTYFIRGLKSVYLCRKYEPEFITIKVNIKKNDKLFK